MDIRADVRIPFAREIVFPTYRDDIERLLPYLSNVRSVEVTSRRETGSAIELVNEWRGGGDLPAAIRGVLGESVLAWTDRATWRSDTFVCDWSTEANLLRDSMQCSGHNTFTNESSGETRLLVEGTLVIDASKLRGVPGFLAGKISRLLEGFLIERIQANLVETADGVRKYLQDNARKGA